MRAWSPASNLLPLPPEPAAAPAPPPVVPIAPAAPCTVAVMAKAEAPDPAKVRVFEFLGQAGGNGRGGLRRWGTVGRGISTGPVGLVWSLKVSWLMGNWP